MLGNVKNICSADQPSGFTCPNGRTVFSSSVIWGAIGPARVYSVGKIYSGLLHFFWIGALMPVITYLLWKYWRKSEKRSGDVIAGNSYDSIDEGRRQWLRLINWPLIFVGTYNVPPATGINYSSWTLVNLVFNWWIKKRWFAWWCKFLPSQPLGLKKCFLLTGQQQNITTSWLQHWIQVLRFQLL